MKNKLVNAKALTALLLDAMPRASTLFLSTLCDSVRTVRKTHREGHCCQWPTRFAFLYVALPCHAMLFSAVRRE